MLAWVVERVAAAPDVREVVLLVPEGARDEPLRRLAAQLGFRCVSGPEEDVLDRFRKAVRQLAADPILRITADCPLADAEVIGQVIDHYGSTGADYASVATGALPKEAGLRRYPDGLDAEVVGAAVLETAWREATDPFEREHVLAFVWRRPERFRLAWLEAEEDMGDERWTVDHEADLAFVRAVYARLAPLGPFGYREVRALLEREPELRSLNSALRVG